MSVYCFTIFFNLSYFKENSARIILFTFVLGLFWELFEIKYNLLGSPFGTYPYYIDTIKDLIMDTLGAIFIWRIIRLKNK